MELKAMDRLILLSVLPREGDFTTLRIVQDLRMALSFSEEENKKLQFHRDGDRMVWSIEADASRDIPIGEKAHDIIVDSFKRLDSAKKLQVEQMEMYERFVPSG